MPRVAITDYTFPSLEIEESILRPLGGELVSGQARTPEALIPLVAEADVVITQFAPVNAAVIASSWPPPGRSSPTACMSAKESGGWRSRFRR
jgi:hypothetical protein